MKMQAPQRRRNQTKTQMLRQTLKRTEQPMNSQLKEGPE
jgi:hypothetical protein